MLKSLSKKTRAFLADDSGVAGLLIAGIIAIVAFSALSVFLNSYIGDRAFERLKATASRQGLVMPAMLAYFYQQSTPTMPCPDTDLDGNENSPCAGPGTVNGTLPWRTLEISRDDAIDGYGNYYTYVLSTAAKDVCLSIGNDYDNAADPEYTGSLIAQTELEVRLTSDSAGNGRYVPFAIVSHGKNGLGATSLIGAERTAPTSTAEINNAAVTPAVIFTGPYRAGTDNTAFDDQVLAPTDAQLLSACKQLTPGQELNASLSENFGPQPSGIDTTKFDTTASAAPPTRVRDANNNGVANFTAATSFLATASGYDFTPTVRPVYIMAKWTPATGSTQAGFSIATRATLSPTGDDFTTGITFRFDDRDAVTSSGTGVPNTLNIRNDSVAVAGLMTSGTYNLIAGEAYILEVYDNGDDVWARITQNDDPTNTAFAYANNVTDDLTGDQRVVFINGSADDSNIDDITIGLPMLALELNGTSAYAATSTNANGTTTGNISLETWVYPKALPTGTAEAALISQWDISESDDSSFRLYLTANGLALDLNDAAGTNDAETFNLGFDAPANQWTHVAITYDRTTRSLRFYKDGAFSRSVTTTLDAAGIGPAEQHFAVGADSVTTPPGNFFRGKISDVRVWDDVRTDDEIRDNFERRLSTAGSESNLVVNWKFDSESGTPGGSADVQAVPATGTDGVLTNATYGGTLAIYFRPFSTEVCEGYKVGAYRCDFRIESAFTTGQIITTVSVPSRLPAIYAKVWGAGGGGYDATNTRPGGSAGFSQGLIQSIDDPVTPGTLVSVSGRFFNIYVGGGGVGSNSDLLGGSGGGASGISNAATVPVAALVAGGGGGASYSSAGTCPTTGTSLCGIGGNGSGPGASYTAARPPSGSTSCSGREGSQTGTGTGPTTTGCPNGGGDPSATIGGGSGSVGTYPLRGGTGYTASATGTGKVGGGGGGGGITGGEAGGHDDGTSSSGGYGGGGGAGIAASGVLNVSGEAGSVTSSVTSFTRTGTPDQFGPGGSNSRIQSLTPVAGTAPTVLVGYTVSGTGISGSPAIQSITAGGGTLGLPNHSVTSEPGAVTLTITPNTGTASTSPGSDDDPYYSPSYTTTAQSPGVGGTTGVSNRDGKAGAVVLIW